MCRVWNNYEVKASRRFFSKIKVSDTSHFEGTACWEWTRCKTERGYGRFRHENKDWLSHRASYALFVATIPLNYTVHHKCFNTSCCNPTHLELVTQRVNNQKRRFSPSLFRLFELNRNKTHCPKGHPYNEENTYIRPGRVGRSCRTCSREAKRLTEKKISLLKKCWNCVAGLLKGKPYKRPKPLNCCKNGHELTAENTYRPPRRPRIRVCRICQTISNKNKKNRQKSRYN